MLQPQNCQQSSPWTPDSRFASMERRRFTSTPSPTPSLQRPVSAQTKNIGQPPVQPGEPAADPQGCSHREVATWASQEGVDPPYRGLHQHEAMVPTRECPHWNSHRPAVPPVFRDGHLRMPTTRCRGPAFQHWQVPAHECRAVLIHLFHERGVLHKRRMCNGEAPSPTILEEPKPNEAALVMLERAA